MFITFPYCPALGLNPWPRSSELHNLGNLSSKRFYRHNNYAFRFFFQIYKAVEKKCLIFKYMFTIWPNWPRNSGHGFQNWDSVWSREKDLLNNVAVLAFDHVYEAPGVVRSSILQFRFLLSEKRFKPNME